VCGVAKSVGYEITDNAVDKALDPLTLGILKLRDGLAAIRHHIVAEGKFTKGTTRFLHHYKRSSWRSS
ncbi:MAG: hypothetical protein WCH75_29390, partial [Candidatus Binatia bacterium]